MHTLIVSANEEQLRQNRRMSSVRIAVENEFAHVTTLFAYLDFARTLRSMQSPISAYYVVATLLKNIHVCMNGGNENSKRFGVMPPSLEAYMNGLSAQSQLIYLVIFFLKKKRHLHAIIFYY